MLDTDRPLAVLRERLDEAEAMLESFEAAVELSGLPPELADTLGDLSVLAEFSVQIQYLTQRKLLPLLNPESEASRQFAGAMRDFGKLAKRLEAAKEQAAAWQNPLSSTDTLTALSQARAFETSFFRFLQPGWYRLKKTLTSRYDIARHAIPPAGAKSSNGLPPCSPPKPRRIQHGSSLRPNCSLKDPHAFSDWLNSLRAWPTLQHPSVRALHSQL